MTDSATTEKERALALRDEALALCRNAGWSPRCVGTDQFEIGVPEIYEELRCLQQFCCVDVSEEIIKCCKKHQQWSPLFEDVEARIALFRGETERAESIWTELLNHHSEVIRSIANNALRSLDVKRKSGAQLIIDVVQSLDRNQVDRADAMLYEALVKAENLDDEKLGVALEERAMSRPSPDHWPWNRDLLVDHCVLELLDQQVSAWEKHVA